MISLYSARDAASTVARYGTEGVSEDVALRVYTTRLLGGDPRLVLHGGGNTSVKTGMTDILGDPVDVLCVKGSGWDMADIEPSGLPAVRLEPLRRLAALDGLGDEEMVDYQRGNLLDSRDPNPSTETLLHAFLPHKFVDHTHADAVLALTDQPDGEAICREVYGGTMGLVPYIMPGFKLAKACAATYATEPSIEGLILLKHGIFTFGETAEEAYERMIAAVTKAEARLERRPTAIPAAAQPAAPAAAIAPILRGLASGAGRLILDFRGGEEVRGFVDGEELERRASGPVTPDHVIRAKPSPLILPPPRPGALDRFRQEAEAAVSSFVRDYRAYFERNNARQAEPKRALDPYPRVILVRGLGLFGLGSSAKAAAVAADLAETTARVVTAAESIGRFESISEADIFDIEYWSLEQAKLGKAAEKPLSSRIVAVTGGASGIGRATAEAFAREGAEVAILDRDREAAESTADRIGGRAFVCDVTDPDSVAGAFDAVAESFGGLDILVSNAGAAWQGKIGEVDEATIRESFELNFYGHQRAAQAAVRIIRAQGLGGVLLFNTSKQAVNPGPDFGPYGLPKAATLFLMRQYTLDHGAEGIRANAVNADRIRGGLLTPSMIEERARARGVSIEDYMAGNLLGREVTADDVGKAFVDLALAEKTTGAVLTVDGGNIAAALR
ncbi:MAG: bifunctional aldolase/short-chain dehydrogenase [Defluviicoccus sp.]|nr:bifunctional aldolase/short-chain dehydrogenase [Defluviicoccus sp.]